MIMSEKKIKITLCMLMFLSISILFFSFSGCKTKTVFVPVETVKTEYIDKIQRDSVHVYDSVFMKMANDTVWLEKYKYLYRDKLVRDSVFIRDSIQIPYPVKGDTEYINRLYWWQKALTWLGAICFFIIAVYIIIKLKMK